MERAIKETERRRRKQVRYNEEHGIVPETIFKSPEEILQATSVADSRAMKEAGPAEMFEGGDYEQILARLESEMMEAAENLEFEKAASLRDRMEDMIAYMAMTGEKHGRRKTKRRGRR
jgi:excinuclease ABC subunit B